jgi:hypothetical protein
MDYDQASNKNDLIKTLEEFGGTVDDVSDKSSYLKLPKENVNNFRRVMKEKHNIKIRDDDIDMISSARNPK